MCESSIGSPTVASVNQSSGHRRLQKVDPKALFFRRKSSREVDYPLDRASARSSERDLRCLRATETICEDESSWTGAVEDQDSSYYSSSM